MKRALIAMLALLVVAASGAGAWWWYVHRDGGGVDEAYAALVPTGPISCPEDPSDLANIEGWAPGAGHAEQMGQTGAQNVGGLAGGLAGGSEATPSPASSRRCVGLKPEFAARFDDIADQYNLIPTDGFDPAVRAADFANVGAAFAFVRDAIHTEGYAGAMRGASGTLQSYGGSPADKALLLAALLAHQDVAVRFVHTSLSDSDLAGAVAAVAAPAAPPPPGKTLDDLFKKLGVDPAQERPAADASRKRVEDAAIATIAGARTATDELLANLTSKNVALAKDAASVKMRWNANLRDHWWLQAQQKGAWVDLDPTLPNATSGTHLGGTPAGEPADGLPDDAIATLTVRLTADRLGAGAAAQTATLVEQTVKLTDAYGIPITIAIADRDVGSDKLAQANSFTPAITFAGDETTGDAFDTSGLAVVRLQVDTALGGSVRHVANRIVLDARNKAGTALDPAWDTRRIAYALTNVYRLLPLAGEIDPGFAAMRDITGLQSLRAFLAYAAAGGNGRQAPPPGMAERYPLEALHYFEYDALVRRLIEDSSNGATRFFFDRPQIAIERNGFDASAQKLVGIEAFDIADNGMIASGGDRAQSVRDNVTRGYVDTESEQRLFAGSGDGGTIALWRAAKKAGVAPTVLQGDRYGGTALGPASAVELAGRPRTGWWSIDPQDGNLVGRMGPDGTGQAMSEYVENINQASDLYGMMQFYGDFFRCIAGGVEAPLSGGNPQEEFKRCAGGAICAYLSALTVGEAFSRWEEKRIEEEQLEVLLYHLFYNVLDLDVPGFKNSWGPSGGAVCKKIFEGGEGGGGGE